MNHLIAEAVQLLQQNQPQKAEALLSPYYYANLENSQFLHFYALAKSHSGQHVVGIDLLKKAIDLQPDVAEYHHNLAAIYRLVGEFQLSEDHYLTALKLKPDYAEAYFNYSATRKFTADDPVIELIETQASRTDLSDADRCFLGFAGGKIFNDVKDYDKAFSYYELGNSSRKVQFDINDFRREIDRTIEVFSAETIRELSQHGLQTDLPVFIIGMPRTGTTLVEQILSSHPQVHGAGELRDIASIAGTMQQHAPQKTAYPECVKLLPVNTFSGFGKSYLKRLKSFNQQASRVINKMPGNFLYLGLISIMFPQAKVIHCRRDPLDTCLSCYFQRFRQGHDYSHDLKHLGLYYREYERLMAHWQQVLPRLPYELAYADLVQNQEAISRELIEYIGVSWDDQCLDFHANQRPVTTASNWQVRRPMNRAGLERWRNYDQHLEGLRQALAGEEN
ncbi:Sulfotransferase domain protein [Gimesia panareensis]|uniref:Sulfotransferase domain protein n=1 Tax=Gimesia panareensis TaxID=2527978 RepID=A0A518FR39_9PLAN|nr:sulfotransferase [Gimesia panareensis]QDV18812.1 Sulfotransferase domain protein [Gimesia panareensis]